MDDDSCVLTFPKYQFWYEAIRGDDYKILEKELQTTDAYVRHKLLNGRFHFSERLKDTTSVDLYDVWHLVVIFCSKETISLFITKRVDIHIKNESGDNFVNNMILAAGLQPQLEDELIDKYQFITALVGKEDRQKFLLAENKENVRPLEFAMNLATMGLFQGK